LAHNCRKEEKRGKVIPQNKFEVLTSRAMKYGVEGVTIKRQEEKAACVVRP